MTQQTWSLDNTETLVLSDLSTDDLMDMQLALRNEMVFAEGERRKRCRKLFIRISAILIAR